MFELGKKYKGVTTGNIRTCVLVGEDESVLKDDKTGWFQVVGNHQEGDTHIEYHEPVVEKIVRHIYNYNCMTDGYAFSNREVAGLDLAGSVEFTITDRKLTDVRIVS